MIQLDPSRNFAEVTGTGRSPGFKLSHVTPLNDEIRNHHGRSLTNCKKLLSQMVTNGNQLQRAQQITLLRVIPTMTFIHFLTGKSSGILSDISSDILFGILSGISSGI